MVKFEILYTENAVPMYLVVRHKTEQLSPDTPVLFRPRHGPKKSQQYFSNTNVCRNYLRDVGKMETMI